MGKPPSNAWNSRPPAVRAIADFIALMCGLKPIPFTGTSLPQPVKPRRECMVLKGIPPAAQALVQRRVLLYVTG
jgi:hypothetical protein